MGGCRERERETTISPGFGHHFVKLANVNGLEFALLGGRWEREVHLACNTPMLTSAAFSVWCIDSCDFRGSLG